MRPRAAIRARAREATRPNYPHFSAGLPMDWRHNQVRMSAFAWASRGGEAAMSRNIAHMSLLAYSLFK